jgi:hypothetical protein
MPRLTKAAGCSKAVTSIAESVKNCELSARSRSPRLPRILLSVTTEGSSHPKRLEPSCFGGTLCQSSAGLSREPVAHTRPASPTAKLKADGLTRGLTLQLRAWADLAAEEDRKIAEARSSRV